MRKQARTIFKDKATIAIMLSLVVVTFLATLLMTQKKVNKLAPVIEVKTEINVKVIEESIRSIAELATLTYGYSDVGLFSEQHSMSLFGKEIGLLGTKKSFIITYDGEMKFGIDLSLISIEDADNILTVMLPPAQILSHTIKEDSIMLLDEKSGLFNHFSITDYMDFMVEQKEKMETRALERNYFEQAQTNAELQIEAFILSIPGVAEEYKIRFINYTE